MHTRFLSPNYDVIENSTRGMQGVVEIFIPRMLFRGTVTNIKEANFLKNTGVSGGGGVVVLKRLQKHLFVKVMLILV